MMFRTLTLGLILTTAPAWGAALEQPGGITDAGLVREGSKKTIYLPIRNPGTETVYIEKVEAGCHCSTPNLLFDRIAPGETQQLAVTFDASGLAGELDRTISIYARGVSEAALVASYHIDVRRIFVTEPEVLTLANAKPAEIPLRAFRIYRMAGKGLLSGVKVNDARLRVSLVRRRKGMWKILVRVVPNARPGPLMAVVSAETSDPASSGLGLLVTGEIR